MRASSITNCKGRLFSLPFTLRRTQVHLLCYSLTHRSIMILHRSLQLFALLLAIFVISACDGPKNTGAGKYGMMDTNIPEYAAVQFFTHIYADDDLTGALEYASPKLARLMKSYRINRNVQRHILNLTLSLIHI